MSTFIESMLFTVSSSVSPFETDDPDELKLMASALNLFSASSNEILVLVEFSKNKFTMVTSRSEGTFFIGLCKTSLNCSAV